MHLRPRSDNSRSVLVLLDIKYAVTSRLFSKLDEVYIMRKSHVMFFFSFFFFFFFYVQDDNTMNFLVLTMPRKNAAWFWKKIHDSDTNTIVSIVNSSETITDDDVKFPNTFFFSKYVND